MSRAHAEEHLREYTRGGVRGGLSTPDAVHADVAEALRLEIPEVATGADAVARAWVAEFTRELVRESAGWPERTCYDRLQDALGDLARNAVLVLQGCPDRAAALAALGSHPAGSPRPRGVVWLTEPAVRSATVSGRLQVDLAGNPPALADTSDALAAEVLAVLGSHGLRARRAGGHLEVATHWRRRP